MGEALAKDLRDLHLEEGTLLQYVDDILVASPSKQLSDKNTIMTLNHLADKEYKVSRKKAQISQIRVTYLGFTETEGKRSLPREGKRPSVASGHQKPRDSSGGF